ncbi:uncharacterized protein P884DRAFT_260766 [Thermothelomyces heterothallicus CBS 202.75]|uniref:uncharacterized protein n=1 Tax=Thermothelomyces heterothallicus CBS 202.75 TaxID=1149848 RepID=UPI003743D248
MVAALHQALSMLGVAGLRDCGIEAAYDRRPRARTCTSQSGVSFPKKVQLRAVCCHRGSRIRNIGFSGANDL